MTTEWKYEINDLVWAKTKGFPPWPGRVSNPIVQLKKKPKNNCKCIFFFGTNNYAWIEDGCLKPYFQFKDTLTYRCKTRHYRDAVKAIEDHIEEHGSEQGVNNGLSEADSRFENLVQNKTAVLQPERSVNAESEVAALNMRIQLLKEDIKRYKVRKAVATAKLAVSAAKLAVVTAELAVVTAQLAVVNAKLDEVSQAADESERQKMESAPRKRGRPRVVKMELKRHKTSHDRKPQKTIVLNNDSMKKEVNNCDCCGEDLATAHTNGDFECNVCAKIFKSKVDLERHQLNMVFTSQVFNFQ